MPQFLQDVDDERKELVARSLIIAFASKLRKADTNYHRRPWNDFADTVYSVTRGNRAMSVVPSVRDMGLAEESSWNDDALTEFSATVTELSEEDAGETIALLKAHASEILSEAREADDAYEFDNTQELLDAQLAAEGYEHGIAVDTSSSLSYPAPPVLTNTVLEGLEEYVGVVDQPLSAPASVRSISDVSEATSPSSIASSRTTIVDLTADNADDTGSDVEIELELTDVREIRGTPVDEKPEEEFVIVGTGRRGRRVLPLRTKSQSVVFLGSKRIGTQRRADICSPPSRLLESR